ncbi:MAG: type II toxin-antitoxin system VapC family toxin [bacterium]
MAELAAVVTDTHPLLFHAAGGSRLGKRARRVFAAAEARRALVYVPVAVMWECSLLVRVGRVDLGRSLEAFFADLFSNPAFQPVDLTPAQIYAADAARPNDDPFDALICAAARVLDLPLVTRDDEMQDSCLVSVVW